MSQPDNKEPDIYTDGIFLLCGEASCHNVFMGIMGEGPYRCPVCKNGMEILILEKGIYSGRLRPYPYQKDGKRPWPPEK